MKKCCTLKTNEIPNQKAFILTLLQCFNTVFWVLIIFNSFHSFCQNVTYQTLYTGSAFNSRSIDQSLPVGSISETAGVASGGATYSISLAVPPGTNSIAPTVSLNYYSMGGNGVLGQGWGIGGLSEITRTTRNMYFDNETNPIVLTNSDRFILDGSRLIAKAGNNGDPNTTYGTESENFATVMSKGTQGGGPQWFEVSTDNMKNLVDAILVIWISYSLTLCEFLFVGKWRVLRIQNNNLINISYFTTEVYPIQLF